MRWLSALFALWDRLGTPPDEIRWRRWRRRIMGAALAAGALYAVQTSLVENPTFLINDLYHSRTDGREMLLRMKPDERAKLLQRLCLARQILAHGDPARPYDIPNPEECQ
jgi:hypothetical protein